jgi:hypothetical protein
MVRLLIYREITALTSFLFSVTITRPSGESRVRTVALVSSIDLSRDAAAIALRQAFNNQLGLTATRDTHSVEVVATNPENTILIERV